MKRQKSKYGKIEEGLSTINKKYIGINGRNTHWTKILVGRIVKKIVTKMKQQSRAFSLLRPTIFGGGSSHEGLKICEPDEFDMDILLKLPIDAKPLVADSTIPGYVQLLLQDIDGLIAYPELNSAIHQFQCVDKNNYVVTTGFKSFIQSVFTLAKNKYFPNGIAIGGKLFTISNTTTSGPALTLSIHGKDHQFDVDLVTCIVLPDGDWPSKFQPNPFTKPKDFFLVPKQPKTEYPHLERFFRLSFQMQERMLLHDRHYVKPTIRIMKYILQNIFHHKVSSYAIKTLFLWEVMDKEAIYDRVTFHLWKSSFGGFFVHMLQKYHSCLSVEAGPKIPYFWYRKLNLLSLNSHQQQHYLNQVEELLENLENNPSSATVLALFNK